MWSIFEIPFWHCSWLKKTYLRSRVLCHIEYFIPDVSLGGLPQIAFARFLFQQVPQLSNLNVPTRNCLQFPIEISTTKPRQTSHSLHITHPFRSQNGTEKVFRVLQVFQLFRVLTHAINLHTRPLKSTLQQPFLAQLPRTFKYLFGQMENSL